MSSRTVSSASVNHQSTSTAENPKSNFILFALSCPQFTAPVRLPQNEYHQPGVLTPFSPLYWIPVVAF
jgi:hypothetical protein